MEEKKNEKKDKKKKWPPAHEVLTVLLGDITCIQTIARACAMGIAVPPEGIPGLINALKLAKSTTIGKVRFIVKDINTSIRNLKKQLTEAKIKDKKEKLVSVRDCEWIISSLEVDSKGNVSGLGGIGMLCQKLKFPPEKIPGMIEAFGLVAQKVLLRRDSNLDKDYKTATKSITALKKQL